MDIGEMRRVFRIEALHGIARNNHYHQINQLQQIEFEILEINNHHQFHHHHNTIIAAMECYSENNANRNICV